jgi:hypothetical protein
MPQKDQQAQRLAAEAAQQHAPPTPVMDVRYRLRPEDIAGGQIKAVVRTVTRQGVEKVMPVVHFAGLTRPLVLDAANLEAMARITGSPLAADWPGHTMLLRVVPEEGTLRVRLLPADAPPPVAKPKSVPATAMFSAANLRATLIFLLVLAAALAAVYLVENAPLALPEFLAR